MHVMQHRPPARGRGMTRRARRDSVCPTAIRFGFPPMPARACLAVIALALSAVGAGAQAPAPSDAAKEMVGAWEISNAARDKTCPVTFKLDPGAGGFKLELDEACGTAFPSLKDVGVWTMGPNDEVRLLNSKGAVVLDFMEVESHMYEAERKGEGLFFMRTQAAIKAATVSPQQVFGEWTLFKEFEKPLCSLTLSSAAAGGGNYKNTVKPGCDTSVPHIRLFTWRVHSGGLLLSGRSLSLRFSASDATTVELIPATSAPPALLPPGA